VGRRLILETTFLVDLEREIRRGAAGAAFRWLEGHRADELYLTFTVAGELACGSSLSERERWQAFVAPFRILPATPDVSWEYGKTFRYLADNGRLIGANDLWIAATALANEMPVVTRNAEHYRRVPGLTVVDYEVETDRDSPLTPPPASSPR
jgi:tRNA(fMet)-specific endonuclease VapC